MKRFMYTVLLSIMAASMAIGADWYTWRGPDGNSISKETGWNAAAFKDGAKILWSADLGEGYSAVSVKDGKVYSMGNIDGEDVIYCLNAADGKVVWTYKYACDDGSYPGPRATPVIDGDKLYTLSREGDLICLDAAKGTKIWVMKVIEDYKVDNIKWGLSSSVKVHGDMLLINAGTSGIALNKTNGKLIWGNPGMGNYATPVVFTRQGTDYTAIPNKEGLNIITVKDGSVAAFHPWEASWSIIAADPVISGDHILLSSGYGKGSVLLKFDGKSLSPVWQNEDLQAQFSSPILIDGFIYTAHGNTGKKNADVRCVELMTGKVQWETPTRFTNLMVADGKLIFINENGLLTIAEAKPDKYTEVSSAQVLEEKVCWTMPVLANGVIYCRNNPGKLVAVDVSK